MMRTSYSHGFKLGHAVGLCSCHPYAQSAEAYCGTAASALEEVRGVATTEAYLRTLPRRPGPVAPGTLRSVASLLRLIDPVMMEEDGYPATLAFYTAMRLADAGDPPVVVDGWLETAAALAATGQKPKGTATFMGGGR